MFSLQSIDLLNCSSFVYSYVNQLYNREFEPIVGPRSRRRRVGSESHFVERPIRYRLFERKWWRQRAKWRRRIQTAPFKHIIELYKRQREYNPFISQFVVGRRRRFAYDAEFGEIELVAEFEWSEQWYVMRRSYGVGVLWLNEILIIFFVSRKLRESFDKWVRIRTTYAAYCRE